MRCSRAAFIAATLMLPVGLSLPAQAKTAFQNWAQGQGVYVSSTVHPPGGLQSFLPGDPYDPAYRPQPGYYGAMPPSPYEDDYGYGDPRY